MVEMGDTPVLKLPVQNLIDSSNYGLYCPPNNGRAGKFLAEERVLGDYALSGPVASLEVRELRRLGRLG